jgi:hypothetical protein
MRQAIGRCVVPFVVATLIGACSRGGVSDASATEVLSAKGLTVTPDSATERAILRARDAIWRAWFADDTAQLSQLLPEAVAAGGDAETGQRWTDRAQTVNEAKQFVATGGSLVSLAFPQTEIRLIGNTAVVFSTFDLTTAVRGTSHTMQGRSTEVFVLRNGRWANPFWHLGH